MSIQIISKQYGAASFNQLLNHDLFSIIRSFQRKSYWLQLDPKEAIYWKNRYTQDVVPLLTHGYRVATIIRCDGIEYPCANCYHYGVDRCDHDQIDAEFGTVVDVRPIPYEEFRINSYNKLWSQEQYLGLAHTLYGRYAMAKRSDTHNPLTIQIRDSKLYNSIQYK